MLSKLKEVSKKIKESKLKAITENITLTEALKEVFSKD